METALGSPASRGVSPERGQPASWSARGQPAGGRGEPEHGHGGEPGRRGTG